MDFLSAIILLIVSTAISAMLIPKQQKPKAAAFDDFDFPQVEENTPQSVVFGDVWIEDWMVPYYGNLRNQAIKAKAAKK